MPEAMPLTKPVNESTEAMAGREELQTPVPELDNGIPEPAQTEARPLIAEGVGLTEILLTAIQPECVYVTEATPRDKPVAIPVAEPIAMVVDDEDQTPPGAASAYVVV